MTKLLLVILLLALPVWSDELKAGLPGYCAIGGEEITTEVNGRKIPNEHYREIYCTYSNGQTARIAVCDQHRYKQKPEVYPILWESIVRGWQADMKTWPTARQEKYWRFYEGVTIQSCDQ